MSYEYKVVPAPTRGLKARGIKSAEDRFAHALETAINELAVEGWEYQRADTLPSEQREGLMGKTTVYQNMLVFRRVAEVAEATAPTPPLLSKIEPPVAAPVMAESASEVAEADTLDDRDDALTDRDDKNTVAAE